MTDDKEHLKGLNKEQMEAASHLDLSSKNAIITRGEAENKIFIFFLAKPDVITSLAYNIEMKFRQALFWDTNPKKIDTKKHAH